MTAAGIVFTAHARDRVRGRLRLDPDDSQLALFVAEGRVTATPPNGCFDRHRDDDGLVAFLVTHEAVFALAPNRNTSVDAEYVALTCVRRRRLSKADRRARRDAARAERDWSDAA